MKNWIRIVLAAIGVIAFSNIMKGRSRMDLMNVSFLGNEQYPRGIRNNNPGNLRRTNIPWRGKIPLDDQEDHGGYEQFYRYVDGARAMILDITNDIRRDGLETIRELMYEYAPPSDNNPTEQYIDYVSEKSGIQEDETLDPNDRKKMRRLIQAMALFENYKEPIVTTIPDVMSDDMFNLAWAMA